MIFQENIDPYVYINFLTELMISCLTVETHDLEGRSRLDETRPTSSSSSLGI